MPTSSNLDVETVGMLRLNHLACLLSSVYMMIDMHCIRRFAGPFGIALHSVFGHVGEHAVNLQDVKHPH